MFSKYSKAGGLVIVDRWINFTKHLPRFQGCNQPTKLSALVVRSIDMTQCAVLGDISDLKYVQHMPQWLALTGSPGKRV